MILEKYSAAPIEFDNSITYKQYVAHKPKGFWVSVKGEDDWPSWCYAADWGIPHLTYQHRVTLAPDANILLIDTLEKLTVFNREFSDFDGFFGYDEVRWPEVAKLYAGIIIAPHFWTSRMRMMWYSGWDCTSGCIWDLSAIAEVTLMVDA